MAFTVLFLAHAPDAESEKHRCLIETSKHKLFVRVVKDQHQAVGVCKSLVREGGIHSILLCPGFTHENVAGIAEVVGKNVGVFVARGGWSKQQNYEGGNGKGRLVLQTVVQFAS